MADASSQTVYIQACLDRLRGGDASAESELLNCACERLRYLARKMLKSYPRVQRWEQTDDVLQNAVVRLHRTLRQVTIETSRDFFRLAALNIRYELLDLVKHYYGPQGHGARHASWHAGDSTSQDGRSDSAEPADLTGEPSRLAAWGEFHEHIAALPDEEREVFDLLWYQGLSQAEAAELLGVSERTIKRRWQTARLKLHDALHGEVPE
jgi:RNA polymerase sigma-70 factor (ECF subfamily)